MRQEGSLLEWGMSWTLGWRLKSPWCGQKGVRRAEWFCQVINRTRNNALNAEIRGSDSSSWAVESPMFIQRQCT